MSKKPNLSSMLTLVLGLGIALAAMPLTVQAQGFSISDTRIIDLAAIGIPEPQGIAYHPIRQTLFIVAKNPGRVVELTTSGQVLNSFMVPEIRKPEGIDYDPVTGNLVISRGNNVLWEATPDGSVVSPFLIMDQVTDADGVAVHPLRGTFFITDDDAESVFEIDRVGRVVSVFKTSDAVPRLTEPHGLGFFGTDLIVSDDLSDALYLFAPDGQLLQTLLSTALLGIRDPEGVAVIGQDQVCAVSDNDAHLFCFTVPQRQLTVPVSLGLPASFVGVAGVNVSQVPNSINAYGFTGNGWHTLFDQVHLGGSAQVAQLTQEIGCCGHGVMDANPKLPEGVEAEPVRVLSLVGQRAPIQGFFMTGDFSLRRLDGIGGALIDSTQLVLPVARRSETVRTIIFAYNPSPVSPATVNLALRGSAGGIFNIDRAAQVVLPPYGSIIQDLEQTFGDSLAVERGFITLSSDRPVRAAEFVVKPASISAASGQIGDRTGTLVAPHFFTGANIGTTTLTLVNLANEANSVTLTAYDDFGENLAETSFQLSGRQFMEVDAGELLGLDPNAGTIQGYLVIRHSGPRVGGILAQGHLAALLTFRDAVGETESSLPFLSESSLSDLYPHVAQARGQGIFQGLALLNWSSSEATVQVQVFNSGGALAREIEVQIAPFNRLVALLDDPRLFGPGFEQQAGYIRVNSDAPLMTFSLFGGARFLSAIERVVPGTP